MSNKQTLSASLINYYSLKTVNEPLKVTVIGSDSSVMVCLNELLKWKSSIQLSGLYLETSERPYLSQIDYGDFIFVDTSITITPSEINQYPKEKIIFFDPENIGGLRMDLKKLTHNSSEHSSGEAKNKPLSRTNLSIPSAQIHFDDTFSLKYGLSRRESLTLYYLVNGHSYKMIAAEMFISIDTVRSHIKRIYQKLGINSNAQAICMVIMEGNQQS